MLQVIRDRITGPTAAVFLALIAVPFIFVGISSPLVGSGYAAKVDGDEISMNLFEQSWQDQIRQNPDYMSYPPQFQDMLRAQILDRLIRDRLITGYMSNAGMRVSDDMVTEQVRQIPAFQENGVFSMTAYRAALDTQGRSTKEFELSMAQSLRQFQLQQAVIGSAFVTPAEYRRYLNLFAEQREVTVSTIRFESIKESVEISEEEIAEFYAANPDQFNTDETVDLYYIEILLDELMAKAVVTEEALAAHYESASNRYMQDERRQARHILILFGDDESAAQEQAKALTARVQAGEPFDDLAKQYSSDSFTSTSGGDLGLLPQTQLPPALGDAVFGMKRDEVTGPVRGDFGFHIVKLDDIVVGGPLPLEQVRAELELELRGTQADADFREKVNAVSNAMFDNLDIAEMADVVGLEVKSASNYTRAGGEPFGANQAAIDAVFDERVLTNGEVSDIVEIDANRSVVVRVSAHHEATLKPLSEVSERITGALQSVRAQEIITDRSDELMAKLRRGEDIVEASANVGAIVSAPAIVSRTDQEIDQRLLATIFRSKKPADGVPKIGGTFTQTEDFAVFSLSAVTEGRPESIPLADLDARKTELTAQSGAADFSAFVTELQRRALIVKNEDVLQSTETFQ
jgi:peptidyl-prolyl cis-trans isomerase D